MSRYSERMQQARQTDFSKLEWLNDFEGAAYTRMGLTKYRAWSADIRHKAGRCNRVRKTDIDAKLLEAEVR